MALTQLSDATATQLHNAFLDFLPLIEAVTPDVVERRKIVKQIFGPISAYNWLENDQRATARWLYSRQPFVPVMEPGEYRTHSFGPNAFALRVDFRAYTHRDIVGTFEQESYYRFQLGTDRTARDALARHLGSHLASAERNAATRTRLLYAHVKGLRGRDAPREALPGDVFYVEDKREHDDDEDDLIRVYSLLVLEAHRDELTDRRYLIVLFDENPH
jgi:hypothetical protein